MCRKRKHNELLDRDVRTLNNLSQKHIFKGGCQILVKDCMTKNGITEIRYRHVLKSEALVKMQVFGKK